MKTKKLTEAFRRPWQLHQGEKSYICKTVKLDKVNNLKKENKTMPMHVQTITLLNNNTLITLTTQQL